MKIGLYGDSFTESHRPAQHFAWFNQLATMLGGVVYNFDREESGVSYGMGASSTYWSYKNFLRRHEQHDLNIFIASDPMKFPEPLPIHGPNRRPKPISGMASLEWYEQDPDVTPEGQEMLHHVKSWTLISHEPFMVLAQELMLQDMERRSKSRLLILPADLTYGCAFTPERQHTSFMKFAMWDIVRVMMRSLNTAENDCGVLGMMRTLPTASEERQDMIAAHMTEECNTWFANSLYNYIMNGRPVVLPEHIPHRFHYNKYLHRN